MLILLLIKTARKVPATSREVIARTSLSYSPIEYLHLHKRDSTLSPPLSR